MTCNDAQLLIARYVDDEQAVSPADRGRLKTHLAECAGCRAVLDAQRDVAVLLRGRLETVPRPGLLARVAARIDAADRAREPGGQVVWEDGWLGLANWRAWTVGLAPIAVALFVAAYAGIGGASSSGALQTTVPSTLEEWTTGAAPAALHADAGGEALIEAVLIGVAPSPGESDVR
jgi:predicted anti-sigma-YlaC factor YlaD